MRARKRQFLAVVVTPAALLSVLNRPERAAGNLQQAIQLYQRAARESSGDRALAAEALMSAARAYEKLGQTEASRSMYAEIVRVYPEQREQVSTANQRLGETGIVQGAVSRSGNREP